MCSINQNPNHMNYIRHIGVLLLALMSTTAWSQSISGTVTDENNQPLPGATVLVQGTTRGVSSDFDGRYLINASQGETLEFSFIGYATQSVVVSAATHDVQLNLDNELEEGIVPNMTKDASTDAFLDLLKITDGDDISISFNASVAQGVPKSTDIVGVYRTITGNVYNATLFSNATLPETFTISVSDIVAAFAEINTASDILLGDVLSITTSFTRSDGAILNIINKDGTKNYSDNIKNSGIVTVVVDYPVSCPSDIGGTYLVSSTGTGCCGVPPITNHMYTVTVTDNGGGSYSLSDYSGGVYDGLFCGPFGICADASTGDITDVCGTLSGKNADCCGDEIEFSGTVNVDGTWSVEIASGFADATSTWTKQ